MRKWRGRGENQAFSALNQLQAFKGNKRTNDELVDAKLLHGVRGGRLLFGLHTTGKIKVTTYVSTEYEQQEETG